jgi:hypothetical protein
MNVQFKPKEIESMLNGKTIVKENVKFCIFKTTVLYSSDDLEFRSYTNDEDLMIQLNKRIILKTTLNEKEQYFVKRVCESITPIDAEERTIIKHPFSFTYWVHVIPNKQNDAILVIRVNRVNRIEGIPSC